MNTSGYSGTPLAKKLGIKPGFVIRLVNEPANYFDLFSDLSADITVSENKNALKGFIHCFCTQSAELSQMILALKNELKEDGTLWISWYKRLRRYRRMLQRT